MNLPIHVISGGIFSIIVYRFLGIKNAIGFFCFASFLDADHYLYYIYKFRKLHIRKAMEYFDAHRDVERFCLCIFHTIEFFIFFSLITFIFSSLFLYACLLGVILHYIVDIAQALYLKRIYYRWWSAISYCRSRKTNEKL
ncbi:MAG: hypothetical protein Q8O13_06195 [Candidatus Omnitrophota bacterium]|nr:hypothetical protein [Candidatus Omnitrophota bacterium]